jgi:flagellar hook-associated protein 3 FlgL
VENLLFRLRELVIQAGDSAYSSSERNVIAQDIAARTQDLQGIYNLQLANGEYLFSGYQGFARPFESTPAGRVEFSGDTGQRSLQISSGVDVEVRDNGKDLFIDIPSANNTFVAASDANNTGSGDINVGRIVDQAAYDAVYPDDLVIVFDDPLGPGSYTINQRDRATGVLTPLATNTYTAGDPVTVAGVEVIVQGTPASGDQFTLAASSTQSLIATIQRVAISIANSPDTTAGDTARARDCRGAEQSVAGGNACVFEACRSGLAPESARYRQG